MIALSGWWTVGWIAAVVVVVLVAVLLTVITGVARKITGETREIIAGLDGVAAKTTSLKDLVRTQRSVAQITRGLRRARGGGPSPSRPGGVGPGMSRPKPTRARPGSWN